MNIIYRYLQKQKYRTSPCTSGKKTVATPIFTLIPSLLIAQILTKHEKSVLHTKMTYNLRCVVRLR